jgi:acetylornithine deacetylase/succinyl-diaminopimelate desuccinylase-like protein
MAETEAVRDFVERHKGELAADLGAWVRIPSVSGADEHADDVRRSARWLAARMREAGFPVAEVWETGGLPAVFAEWPARAPSPVTVLVYGHHDVRSVRADAWRQTGPFTPRIIDGRLHGRGSSDAKGQLISHLYGIRAQLAATGGDAPAVHLKFLIEGEEETGSAHLDELLRRFAPRLTADLVVYTDTTLWRADAPAVCLGIRGSVPLRLTVRGPLRDVHRGLIAGAAPNPCTELCRVLAGLHDADGRVAVPGFYEDVDALSEDERAGIAALPYTDEDWLTRTQSRAVQGDPDYPVLERVWTRPSLEVLTLTAGDPDGPARGSIPAEAAADLSAELVPNQCPDKVADLVRRWLAERISPRVDYELAVSPSRVRGYRTPEGHPAVEVLAGALTEAFGRPAGRMRNGGTGPAALLAERVAPVVFFGTGLPEDRWHDRDERADLDVLCRGAVALALFWLSLPETDLAPGRE